MNRMNGMHRMNGVNRMRRMGRMLMPGLRGRLVNGLRTRGDRCGGSRRRGGGRGGYRRGSRSRSRCRRGSGRGGRGTGGLSWSGTWTGSRSGSRGGIRLRGRRSHGLRRRLRRRGSEDTDGLRVSLASRRRCLCRRLRSGASCRRWACRLGRDADDAVPLRRRERVERVSEARGGFTPAGEKDDRQRQSATCPCYRERRNNHAHDDRPHVLSPWCRKHFPGDISAGDWGN